jgi:hypothetical protein
MFRVFLEFAFMIMLSAWVLTEVLSVLGRWADEHRNSEPEKDIEMDPAKDPEESNFRTLGLVFAIVLLFLLLMPNAVNSNGRSISLADVSDSIQASKDVGIVGSFVSVWRAEDPLEFWSFFGGLLVTVIWLFRRSPASLGLALVASFFALWLKMNSGISTLPF